MDIKNTIAQLTAERDRIDAAITALQALEGDRAAPASRRRSRSRRTPQNGRTAVPAIVTQGAVLKQLTPYGVKSADIRTKLHGSEAQILRRLKELEASGRAKRTGERRTTRWHKVA